MIRQKFHSKTTMNSVLQSARLPFLLLTPVCLFLGLSFAWGDIDQLDSLKLILILVTGLSAHISVNTFNEYLDFKSGLDAKTVRTPFSGGSGALTRNPNDAKMVLITATGSMLITAIVGLYLSYLASPLLLFIGLIGLLLIVTYTSVINRFPLLCLVAPGLAFGPLMVMGTYLTLTDSFGWPVMHSSLIPFCLVNNLLLLNQFPDIEADKTVGRNHLPIAYGVKASSSIYLVFLVFAAIVLFYLILMGVVSDTAYWVLLPLSLGLIVFFGSVKYSGNIRNLTPFLAINVMVTLISPTVLAVIIIQTN